MELSTNPEEMEQQIEQRINELPADVQNAILSSDFGDKVLAIGSAAKLHIDQIQNLNDIAMLGMLGFMPLDQLDTEISKQLAIPSDTAKKIATEVNTQIFLPIRESMKKFAAGEAAPAPVATPAFSSKPPLSEILPKGNMPQPAAAEMKPSFTPLPVTSAPIAAPAMPIVAPPIMPVIPSVPKIEMHPADIMLNEKTVAMPPAAPAPSASAPAAAAPKPVDTKAVPPKPVDYKADPYREPIN